jgi:hypothetical protein
MFSALFIPILGCLLVGVAFSLPVWAGAFLFCCASGDWVRPIIFARDFTVLALGLSVVFIGGSALVNLLV